MYAMIDAGLMTKTTNDSRDDFQAVFDFDEAFSRQALLAQMDRLSHAAGR